MNVDELLLFQSPPVFCTKKSGSCEIQPQGLNHHFCDKKSAFEASFSMFSLGFLMILRTDFKPHPKQVGFVQTSSELSTDKNRCRCEMQVLKGATVNKLNTKEQKIVYTSQVRKTHVPMTSHIKSARKKLRIYIYIRDDDFK